jgi:hypothetical protein
MGEKTSTYIQQADLQLVSSDPNIDTYGTKRWYNKSGQLHREDGPAVELANGNKEWWSHANLHRENAPAIELASGTKFWILNGQLHRKDGPAREWASGDKEWYLNNKRHRENGPAVEQSDGTKEWWVNGKSHRRDGPAKEYPGGRKEWYLDGERHRVNGPAVEWSNGSKEWWLNGQRHREDGPAIEYANGDKEWYLKGKFCRKEVTIIEWADKTKRWCFPERAEIMYTEIELEFLPEIFEDTQTVYSQEGGTVYDLNGWLHLEGLFSGQELKSLLVLISPCIKTPVQLTLTKPEGQGEQTLTLEKSGVYNQSGHKITLDLDSDQDRKNISQLFTLSNA